MTPLGPPLDAARGIAREVARTQLRAKRGITLLARRPPAQIEPTPKDQVWSLGKAKVWRYRSEQVRHRRPVLLFMGLVGDPAIFDLHPGNSWAQRLVDEGFDVFLFDWGRPEAAEGDHSLDTYLNGYLVPAVRAVRRLAGSKDVSLAAYCMGALMALLLLGSNRSVPAGSLVLFTPPCDYDHSPGFLANYRSNRLDPAQAVDHTTGLVPEAAVRAMFRLLAPTSDVVQYVTLWENLWRDDYVESHRAVNHWAWSHRPMAGPSFIEMINEYVRDNALVTGTARLGPHAVDLQTITVPVLVVVAERDEFVPPANSEPLPGLLGSKDVEVLRVPGGHAGALMGSAARRVTVPGVVEWLTKHATSRTSAPRKAK
jgi:polyhydroxyalkanoate synthase subunit PhaC